MNHDVFHCLNYKKDTCPADCFRAQVTAEVEEHVERFAEIPLSYMAFLGSSECPLSETYKPPKTWGDTFRAMSNEQMANQFAVWGICPEGKLGGKTRRCRHFGLCAECWKAFLEEVP